MIAIIDAELVDTFCVETIEDHAYAWFSDVITGYRRALGAINGFEHLTFAFSDSEYGWGCSEKFEKALQNFLGNMSPISRTGYCEPPETCPKEPLPARAGVRGYPL